MYREAHPELSNAELNKKVRKWKANIKRMAICKTIVEQELIYEQTPPSVQAKMPQIPSPVTITSLPKAIIFPSPILPKDEDELAEYFIQKWRLEQQQAEDGLKI